MPLYSSHPHGSCERWLAIERQSRAGQSALRPAEHGACGPTSCRSSDEVSPPVCRRLCSVPEAGRCAAVVSPGLTQISGRVCGSAARRHVGRSGDACIISDRSSASVRAPVHAHTRVRVGGVGDRPRPGWVDCRLPPSTCALEGGCRGRPPRDTRASSGTPGVEQPTTGLEQGATQFDGGKML